MSGDRDNNLDKYLNGCIVRSNAFFTFLAGVLTIQVNLTIMKKSTNYKIIMVNIICLV